MYRSIDGAKPLNNGEFPRWKYNFVYNAIFS